MLKVNVEQPELWYNTMEAIPHTNMSADSIHLQNNYSDIWL